MYDGKPSLKPSALSASEDAFLKEKVLPAARAVWHEQGSDADCSGGTDSAGLDVARGAFTRPGSDQRAILYRYCTTGHNQALNGVAVIEGERLAAHVVYEGSWSNAVGALPDLNGNGLSEILLAEGGTNQGITWGAISIIELSEGGVQALGSTETYSDTCGTGEKNCRVEAYKISVKPGGSPVFFREAFSENGDGGSKGGWKKLGGIKEILLRKDETEYELVVK